jgi:hypothetical protein
MYLVAGAVERLAPSDGAALDKWSYSLASAGGSDL